MIAIILSIFLLAQSIAFTNGAVKCSKEEYLKADAAFLNITVVGNPYAYFPETGEGIILVCKDLDKDQQLLKAFLKKCLDTFSKQTTTLLLRGVNKELKKYCGEKHRATFIAASGCMANTLPKTKACFENFVKQLKQVSNAPQDDKLPFVCCATYNFQDCMKGVLSGYAGCSKESTNAYMGMVKGYTNDVRSLVCGGTDEGSPRCAEANAKFKKLAVKSTNAKSPLLPFLDITNTLSS